MQNDVDGAGRNILSPEKIEENQIAQIDHRRYILIGDRMTINKGGHDLKQTWRN